MDYNTRIFPQNAHIHLMGICGVGMSSLAGMLKEKGYTVTGSDHNIYPPISTFLESLSISVKKGYSPQNLHPTPDLVIVGNVITRNNPESEELLRLDIPYLSMPQALKKFAMNTKKSIVIAGTHGKTTVSALTAWIFELAGLNPSFMIGGIAKNFNRNFKLSDGPYFVIEGDEYDSAFFDKGPKFLHYNPYLAAITSIEFDHADIYKGIQEIKNSFTRFIEIVPKEGTLCVNSDDPVVVDVIKGARCAILSFAIRGDADLTVGDVTSQNGKTRFTISKKNKEFARITTDLFGNHNISNILAATAISSVIGISHETIVRAIGTFKGVKRRLEVLGEYKGVMVIDDFAHHPTAVSETIKAVKGHYGNRRLVAVFEPRSNSSRRNIFQNAYADSFTGADLVILPEPPMMDKIPLNERFSSPELIADLKKRGIEALYFPDNQALLDGLLAHIKPGDVILVMSNGAFDNIQGRLVKRLKENK
ncbi:MAG: UDP-N-acetylmuramate:L-alanyl-gamma-D-glutamyl-meso-diaminopimelate ligase [Deltaproteobacteria bacterium]|nr:MAG: UDP-N-acetylmuramate:L-alanyl-gamma-D-glutamyl-meso-diaminopimelate ligase [Deltaproteobacteria bacterium]